jgi:hypothetical protein
MERSSITLTVLFDAPFWVGIFEWVENGQLTVAKVTFGAEPKDYEVHDFVLKHFYDLKFSPAVAAERSTRLRIRSAANVQHISRCKKRA